MTKELITRQLEEMSPSREWNLVQVMLQEIQANDEIAKMAGATVTPSLPQQIEVLKERIKVEFKDTPGMADSIIENYLPSRRAIQFWTESDRWKAAVNKKMKSSHVFDNLNQLKVLDSILSKATTKGDMKAAELYFKLEGTLSPNKEKADAAAAEADDYSALNKIIHNKKK